MKKNNLSSNKGFSLIELIVAIAILGLLIPAIMSAFASTEYTMRDENSKLDVMISSQTIAQSFKALGYKNLDNLYGKIKQPMDTNTTISFYIYFNNNDDIETLVDSSGYDSNNYKIVLGGLAGDFQNAKSKRINDKQFGANIIISINGPQTAMFKLYKVKCIVWDMNNGRVNSERIVYIGE